MHSILVTQMQQPVAALINRLQAKLVLRLDCEQQTQNEFRLQPVYKSGYRLLHLRHEDAVHAQPQAA